MTIPMTENRVVRVAIDGPSGAGKSTIAKRIAAEKSYVYIDTGAMYRAIALKIISEGIDPVAEPDRLNQMLECTNVDFAEGHIMLDCEDVSDRIRTQEVTAMASSSSALPQIREKLVDLQRAMGRTKSVVMDGRDIGTNVFPDADYKFFMTASPEERARRRYVEVSAAGGKESFEDILAAIVARDYDDSHRDLNPLAQADDAILIDTDGFSIEKVTEKILSFMV